MTALEDLLTLLTRQALDRQAPTREQMLAVLHTGDEDVLDVVAAASRRHHRRREAGVPGGLLKDGQAERLRAAGVHAYNHNLNTSAENYPQICSTHTFADRVTTVANAKRAGLSPCSGAIFGMGETDDDRQMIADAGFVIEGADEPTLPHARRDLVAIRRRGAGTDVPANT